MFFISTIKGKISAYHVDYISGKEKSFEFTLTDECDFLDDPHGSILDSSQENRIATKALYEGSVRNCILILI